MTRKFKILYCSIFTSVLAVFLSIDSFALSDDEILKVIEDNKDFFVNNNITSDIFRWIGWSIIKGLKTLADMGESLYKKTFELLTFSTNTDFNTWLETYKPLYIGLLAVSLVILGIILIFAHEKCSNAFLNLLLSIAIITCSLFIMGELNKLIKTGVDTIVDNSPSTSLINDNFYDLFYIDVKKGGLANMSSDKYGTYHYDSLSDKDISFIDIQETINPNKEGLTAEGSEILDKRIDVVSKAYDSTGNKLADVYNGLGWNSQDDDDLFNEFYYRYKVDYLPTILGMLAYIIVYLTLSYKVCRIIFELGTSRFLAVLYSADLTGGQKTKKIIASIKDGYIVLLFTAVLIKLFSMFVTYASTTFADNALIRSFIILFAAFAVSDGPNIIEKLTGIDAGLKSGVGKMFAMYHAARGAAALGTVPAKLAYQQHMQKQMQRGIVSALQNGSTAGNNPPGAAGGNPPGAAGSNSPGAAGGNSSGATGNNSPGAAGGSSSGATGSNSPETTDGNSPKSTNGNPSDSSNQDYEDQLNGYDPDQNQDTSAEDDMSQMDSDLNDDTHLYDDCYLDNQSVTYHDTVPDSINNSKQMPDLNNPDTSSSKNDLF